MVGVDLAQVIGERQAAPCADPALPGDGIRQPAAGFVATYSFPVIAQLLTNPLSVCLLRRIALGCLFQFPCPKLVILHKEIGAFQLRIRFFVREARSCSRAFSGFDTSLARVSPIADHHHHSSPNGSRSLGTQNARDLRGRRGKMR